MSKGHMRKWKSRALSLLLVAAMLLEPSMISSAAGASVQAEETVQIGASVQAEEAVQIGASVQAGEAETVLEAEKNTAPSEDAVSGNETGKDAEPGTDAEEPGTDTEPGTDADEPGTDTEPGTDAKKSAEESVPAEADNSVNAAEDFVLEGNVLVQYNGTDREVEIPEGVVEISSDVFNHNTTMEYVKLPSSLQRIGDRAFYSCNRLAEVVFTNGTEEELVLGAEVFASCTFLERVTLPDSVKEIPDYAFQDDHRLEEIELGNAVTTISRSAFRYCSALEKIECPASLKTIEAYAFNGCTGLREVVFNEGLLTIGTGAFTGAGFGGKDKNQKTEYGTITIPSTVTKIESQAFQGSDYLGEVVFANGSTEELVLGEYVFFGCKNLKKVTLSDSVKKIPKQAFYNDGALEEVTFGNALTDIGQYAFEYCKALKKAEFPETLTTIDNGAFLGCEGLKEVVLNEGLLSIGIEAFSGAGFGGKTEFQTMEYGTLTIPGTVTAIGDRAFMKSLYLKEVIFTNGSAEELVLGEAIFFESVNLKKVTLSDSVKKIPRQAFYNDGALEEVTFGNALTDIGQYAFEYCKALKKAEFPETLTTIDNGAFLGCEGLREVVLNEGLLSIGIEAFSGAGFGGKTETQAMEYGTITIPGTVTTIGDRAFRKSLYLGEVIFTNGSVEELVLGENSFSECKNLKKVTLSDSIKKIPRQAFYIDSALEEVTFGNALTDIDQYAFEYCKALKKAEFPATLKTIGDYAFSSCEGLREAVLNEGLLSIGIEAFSGAGFGGKTEFQTMEYGTLTIPGTVTAIGDRAFMRSLYLKEVIFTNGSAEELVLGEAIFFEGVNLKKVTLSDSVKKIPRQAFFNNGALEEVTFGNAVTEIAQYAFEYCQRLKKVEFPASLRVIDNDAFNGCTSLQEICFNEGLQVIGDRAFSSAPLGGKDENQKLVYGKLTIPSTVYEMGNYVFRDCTYLEEVSFANGATAALEFKNRSNQYLDAEVFYNCENLKRIYFPNRLKTIPSRVITRCPKLEKLYIPATVEEINEDFLKDCGAKKLTIYGDFNTAAERFATSHKISFKSKQELGIYATSIRLNRTKAVFYGGPSIGRQFVLQAKVLPDTALNKNVVFSSENEQVATVDQEGVVTVTGYGQTLIWAASAEDESIKEACEITVLRVWTEDEVQEVLEYLSNNNEHYLLTNVYGSVGDIELQAPDGVTVEWKEPEEEIQSGVHRYQIRLHKEGYETAECPGFTILGLTVTGVQVEPVVSVQKGKQYPVSVKLLTEGATGLQLQEGRDYQLEWSSANSANVSVEAQDDPERTLPDDPLKAVITGNKVSKNTAVSLKIVFNRDGKAVSVEKKDLGKTWFMATSKVTVCDYAIADGIKVTAKEGEKDIELQALESLYNVPSGQTYELQAQVFADSELIENTALTWKSNNPKVASVKADKTGKAALKIAGKGTALITVTAAKNGGYSYSFRVVVKDSKPRLAQKTVTMNRFRLYTAAEVTLYPSDGYAIDESSLSVVNAKDNSPSIFKIKKIDGDTYEIAMENGDAPKKGTYSLKILAKTSAGEEQSHELPITVKVIEQKPVVTIQQDPINLYEKDGYGTVRIRTDADIESITYTPDAGIGNVRLVAGEVNVEYEYFRFVAENALKDNFAKAANKGTLKVTFNGYRDEIYYESKITLAVNKAPKLVATVLYPTLYPGTAADTTLVFLENTNGTLKGLESNKEAVITTSTPGYICKTTSIYAGYANMTLQALSGAKAGKVAFTVTSEDWYDTVRPQVTCNIKLGKTPALSFSSPVITLNTAYTLQDYDVARVYAYVEGSDVAFVGEKTQFTGKNAQAQAALDDGALSLSMEGGVLQAGIVDADYFKKAGTYAYEMTAYTAEGESVKGSFKIKVVLAKNAPSLSLSAKGQINLLDRDNTYVSLTPKFKNCSGLIQNAKLYGADAEKFRLGMAVDEIRVFAVKGAKLKANTACNLGIRVTLDSDAEFKIPLKITPKQKAPKLTASAKTVTLYETVKGEPYEQKFSIYSQASQGSNIEIEDIRLAQDSDTFGYRRTTGGDGYLYVKDKASVVAGKTYTLKLEVTFKDSAVNMKPSYVTVKVVYNK